ncbi:aryl-phospho-beta-D-glucosidase BglC (GH1 family) [Rhodoblastus acidophilus]|nr:aryl-phospho-beta-D-glucosidase BglC (GH1 family) [Rhodoblastus acidophilus]
MTLTNIGSVALGITSITASGDFAQTNDCPASLVAGAHCTIHVSFTPTVAGARTGLLSIMTDANLLPVTVSLSGSGVGAPAGGLPRLSISGNQFVDPQGNKVRLHSVNWFGAEGTNYTPHGTWARKWTDILAQIKGMGFNCIRLPFSGDICNTTTTPPGTAIDAAQNPDLVGKTAIQIIDMIVDWCQTNGVYIVLDHHRCVATGGNGTDGWPDTGGATGSYSAATWHSHWVFLANRYKDNTAVVGADIHNEPYKPTWSQWATLAEACGNAILAAAPEWLIFVEGVGQNSDSTSYWWGGALKDVATRPIALLVANKVVYSPHDYGVSVSSQNWLATDGSAPDNWPTNLYSVFSTNWGFIFEQNIAPIWIGEAGGKFGVDGSGNATVANGTPESAWFSNLVKYLNGDFNGDATNDLTGGKKGMSMAYWCFNPNSGDTGGLVRDDWTTPQSVKLALLAPFLSA